MRRAIAWSYDLLAADERFLLPRLGVFVGSFTAQAAAEVCLDPTCRPDEAPTGPRARLHVRDTLDRLASLVDKSLLRVDPSDDPQPRFRLLVTIRDDALERLEVSGDADELRRRHARYFLALAEQSESALMGSEQVAWLERLEREHNNLRAALRWSIERGDAELGLRLCGVLWRFWWLRGYLSEGRGWLTELLARDVSAVTPAIRARGLVSVGLLALWHGDYPAAQSWLDSGLNMARAAGAPREAAYALTFLSRVARDQGRDANAIRLGTEAVEGFRVEGDRWGRALALHFLGLAEERLDGVSARRRFEESAVLFRALGSRWDLAMPLRVQGLVAYQQGDYAAAQAFFEESLALFQERADRWSVAMDLHGLGHIALHRGDPRQAEALLAECLRTWHDLGNPRGIALGLAGLAAVAAVDGEALRAATLFGAAERLRAHHGLVLEPTDRADDARYVALARQSTRPDSFARAWEKGRAAPLLEAIDAALEPPDRPELSAARTENPAP